jgi:hypothetical protein
MLGRCASSTYQKNLPVVGTGSFFLKKKGVASLRHVVAMPLQDSTYSINFTNSSL